ncbi:hypothetical protein PV326_009051 [Microctonus aethiopoides]|nr:hypothetical protein PV326_009051 [Microctonus aethiopoides]
MIVRKRIWPKTISDGLSMGFILIIVPLIYWFELWVVLPELYEVDSLCIRHLILSIKNAKIKNGWRFCSSCEAVAPPRSWHCQICNTCILKRDHHCIFTGCCIGHNNHLKIIFPLAIFVFGFDDSWEQFYLMLYIVSVVGMCFTGALCIYHFHLMITGSVAYERNHGNHKYNLGWRHNIEDALGKRWFITWLFPYINSQLVNDGLLWNTNSSWMNNSKNR